MDHKVFLALVAFAAFLAYLALVGLILFPFLRPLLWAAIIGIATYPLYLRLRRRLGGRNILSAGVMTVAVVLALVIPSSLLLIFLAREATDVYKLLSSGGADLGERVQQVLELPLIQSMVTSARTQLEGLGFNLKEAFEQGAQRVVNFMAANTTSLLKDSLVFTMNQMVMVLALFFIFKDGEALKDLISSLISMERERREQLLERVKSILRAVIYGVLLTCIVQGVLSGLGYWIAGIRSPVLLGAMTGIAALIPFVGTSLIMLPAVAFLLIQGEMVRGLLLLAWGLVVVGASDNFIRPLFISGRAEISLILVALGLLGGLTAFGLVGAVAGPVVLSLLVPVLQMYRRQQHGGGA